MSKFSIDSDPQKGVRPKINDMDKSLHITIAIHGPDVDKISVRDYLDNLSDEMDFKVGLYQSNIYFREPETKSDKKK